MAKKAYDRLLIARDAKRLTSKEVIEYICDDFFELKGDRLYGEDFAVIGGVGTILGMPVTIIGQQRGKNLEEQLHYNYGMSHPEGYRKAQRLVKQAEKFNRPVLFIVDTPGAYPGIEAEQRGQASAIATSLKQLSEIKVPTLSIILSQGGSGGALAFALCDEVWMFENAFYSILSPEGCATILYKDSSKSKEVADMMKSTAQDLKEFGIIDEIIKEPRKGVRTVKELKKLDTKIVSYFEQALKVDVQTRLDTRYQKYRQMGSKETV